MGTLLTLATVYLVARCGIGAAIVYKTEKWKKEAPKIKAKGTGNK